MERAEDWGTWSTAKACSLRLKLDPMPAQPVRVEIACRAFVHEAQLQVSCRIGDAAPQQWIFTPTSNSVSRCLFLDPAMVAPDGQLTIVFALSDPGRRPISASIPTFARSASASNECGFPADRVTESRFAAVE